MKSKKNIALFGGSFNPPHEGHYEMARRVARRKTIDEVWILPVWRHPLGKKSAPFSERMRLCRAMFNPLAPKVKVKDLEKRLGGTSWTVRILKYLNGRYPTVKFSWIMGADAYAQRNSWKEFLEIRKLVSLVVFPRGKKSPIPDVSSKEIRNKLRLKHGEDVLLRRH